MEELLEASTTAAMATRAGNKRSIRKTPQEKLAILEFLAAGGSTEDAAVKFGVSRTAVAKMLKDSGSESTTAPVANVATGMNGQTCNRDAVVDFVTKGGSVTAAAANFGLTRAEVTKFLQDTKEETEAKAATATQQQRNREGEETVEDSTDAAMVSETAIVDAPDPNAAVSGNQVTNDLSIPTESADMSTLAKRKSIDALDDDTVDATGTNRSKRVRKTKEEKLAILQFVEQGGTHLAAAEKFGVSRTAVTKIVKEKELISLKLGVGNGGGVTSGSTASSINGQAASNNESTPTSSSSPMATVSATLASALHGPIVGPIPPRQPPRKGNRVRKTNVEKLEILAFVEQGGSHGAAAEKFGVSRTAVTKMVKEKDAISVQALSERTTHRKVLQYQHKLSIIEDMLYKWQMQVEIDAPNLKVTGDLLQSKAMEFRNKVLADFSGDLPDDVVVSLTDFKASNGWLHRYVQRRNIRTHSKQQLQGAQAHNQHFGISAMTIEQRIERIRAHVAKVPLECIWNVDEVALRYRTTSLKPDARINLDGNVSQERLTVTFAVSAAGEKLPLEVIGKDPQPVSLKDVNTIQLFGIHYYAQKRAWQDSSTLMHIIQSMNREAKARNQIWFILMDACSSHVSAANLIDPTGSIGNGFRFESVVLLLLPANSDKIFQPLHQGVVDLAKTTFRWKMLQTLLHAYELWQKNEHQNSTEATTTGGDGEIKTSLFDIHSHTHLRNALSWLQSAWDAVTNEAIRLAWGKSAYLPPTLVAEAVQGITAPITNIESTTAALSDTITLTSSTGSLLQDLGLDGFETPEEIIRYAIGFDESEPTGSDEVNDDEIVMESLSAQGLIRDATHSLESDKDLGPEIENLTDARIAVEKLLRFLDQRNSHISVAEQRSGRSNLLALQRILLKARAQERSATTAYTV